MFLLLLHASVLDCINTTLVFHIRYVVLCFHALVHVIFFALKAIANFLFQAYLHLTFKTAQLSNQETFSEAVHWFK